MMRGKLDDSHPVRMNWRMNLQDFYAGSVEALLDQLGVPWANLPNPGRIRLSLGCAAVVCLGRLAVPMSSCYN